MIYIRDIRSWKLFEEEEEKWTEGLLDISEVKKSQALLNISGIKLGGISFGNKSEALLNISGIKLLRLFENESQAPC